MSQLWNDIPRNGEPEARALITRLKNARLLIAEGRAQTAASEVTTVIGWIEGAMVAQRRQQIAVERWS